MKAGRHTFTRRELIGLGVAGIGAPLLSGCAAFKCVDEPTGTPLTAPTILARVSSPTQTAPKGTTAPYASGGQDAVLYVPAGYIPPYARAGMPKFFLSQGTSDDQFDITQSGDFIDSKLVAAGYDVAYARFDGVHEIPDAIVRQALTWLAT